MTLKVRRILSLLFIIFFLITAPIIILYAAGYKLKRNGLAIQRTGMFVIESKPRGAKIFINDKLQKNLISTLFNKKDSITTPAKIKGLLPGEYDLTVVMDGYTSWHKKLIINPGATTFVKDIYLFKNNLPVQITPLVISAISFAPGKNQAVIVTPNKITLFNFWNESEKTLEEKKSDKNNIIWSASGQKFIFNNFLYEINDLDAKVDLKKLIPDAENYQWYDETLYSSDKNTIYRLENKNFKRIIEKTNFSDYLIKDGKIYLIKKDEPGSELQIISQETRETLKTIKLPAQADFSFINFQHPLINLYDNVHEKLYLLTPRSDYLPPLIQVINNVKTTFWADDNSLLYANAYEIWLYNLSSGQKTLITRISSSISQAIIHPNNKYILYSTAGTIETIELDDREPRNTAELVKFDSIGFFTLNSRGDTLYFTGKIGNSGGLYKLTIQ